MRSREASLFRGPEAEDVLVVHEVDPGRNLLLVRGSVPGPKSGIVEIREVST